MTRPSCRWSLLYIALNWWLLSFGQQPQRPLLGEDVISASTEHEFETCQQKRASLPWDPQGTAPTDEMCVDATHAQQFPQLSHEIKAQMSELAQPALSGFKSENLVEEFGTTLEQFAAEFIENGKSLIASQVEAAKVEMGKLADEQIGKLTQELAETQKRLAEMEQSLRASRKSYARLSELMEEKLLMSSLGYFVIALWAVALCLLFSIPMLRLVVKKVLSIGDHIWMFEENQTWHPVAQSIQAEVETGFTSWKRYPESCQTIELQCGRFTYIFDFFSNEQRNKKTGKRRKLRRTPNHAARVLSAAMILWRPLERWKDRALIFMISCLKPDLSEQIARPSRGTLTAIQPRGTWQWQGNDGTFKDYEPHVNQLIEETFGEMYLGQQSELLVTNDGREVCIYGCSRQSLSQCVVGGSGHRRCLRWVESYTLDLHDPSWTAQATEVELVDVPPASVDHAKVVNLAFGSGEASLRHEFCLLKIQRVQNKYLKRLYATERDNIIAVRGAHHLNEIMLFHGSGRNAAERIVVSREGFMLEHASKGLYGSGLYFAHDPRYSASSKYAHKVTGLAASEEKFQILICSLLRGKIRTMGPAFDRDLSRINLPADEFDSVEGGPHRPTHSGPGPKASLMSVVYKGSQVYPEFIITFRKLRPGEINSDRTVPVEAG